MEVLEFDDEAALLGISEEEELVSEAKRFEDGVRFLGNGILESSAVVVQLVEEQIDSHGRRSLMPSGLTERGRKQKGNLRKGIYRRKGANVGE